VNGLFDPEFAARIGRGTKSDVEECPEILAAIMAEKF
jgi:hypothetical protein